MHRKIFCLFILITSLNVYAFKLSPIVQSFDFEGKNKTKTFRVINTNKKTIRLEAEVFTRNIDLLNIESRTESEDFIIYPPQLELKPGQSRAIRVTYTGKPVQSEVPYRLIVRQIPDKLAEKKKSKNQINFLLEYIASLYVAPKDIKPDLIVTSAMRVNNNIDILFENRGTEHVLLRQYKIELKQGNKKDIIDFKSERYKKMGTQNILAGIKRKISFKNTKFDIGKIEVKFIPIKD